MVSNWITVVVGCVLGSVRTANLWGLPIKSGNPLLFCRFSLYNHAFKSLSTGTLTEPTQYAVHC